MDAVNWLMAANVIIWLGIGGYVAFLGARQRALAMLLEQIQISRNGNER